MTRRVFTTEDGWYVATGWDRQLQHFFIDISKECCDGDDPTCEGPGIAVYAYNNLEDPNLINTHGGMTLAQVREVLESKLTAWPTFLTLQLELDRNQNLGNEVRNYHTPIGSRLKDA